MASALPYNPGSALLQKLIDATTTANTTSDTVTGTDKYSALVVHVKIAAIGGTSPTLNVYLQMLAADGTTWFDIASMTQITANGSYMLAMVSGGNSNFTATNATLAAGTIRSVPFGGNMRIQANVGGTSPTMTLTVGIEFIE